MFKYEPKFERDVVLKETKVYITKKGLKKILTATPIHLYGRVHILLNKEELATLIKDKKCTIRRAGIYHAIKWQNDFKVLNIEKDLIELHI